MQEQTLYERIGGEEGIDKLVLDFYERVLADPILAPFFEHTPMEKLRCMQHEFFAAALDGPVQYSGMALSHAHYGRGITNVHVGRFMEHLTDTIRDQINDADEAYEMSSRIALYADDITSRKGLDG